MEEEEVEPRPSQVQEADQAAMLCQSAWSCAYNVSGGVQRGAVVPECPGWAWSTMTRAINSRIRASSASSAFKSVCHMNKRIYVRNKQESRTEIFMSEAEGSGGVGLVDACTSPSPSSLASSFASSFGSRSTKSCQQHVVQSTHKQRNAKSPKCTQRA